MRKLIGMTVFVIASSCLLMAARGDTPQDAQPGFSSAIAHRLSAYIMLIRLRSDIYQKWKDTGVWPADADENKALDAHGKYWDAQLKAGRAILAGGMNGDYWDNVALIVFEAGSQAEAEQIVKDDPAVKAYVFQAQVRPFDVSFITNKYSLVGGAQSARPAH